MAYKKKSITETQTETDTNIPEPFTLLNKKDLGLVYEYIEYYDLMLGDKHPSQLNGYYDLGRTYPNEPNIISLCNFYIKNNSNDNSVMCKKVLCVIGYKHLTGL